MWEEICLSVKPVAKAETSFSLSLLFTCFIAFLFRRFFARVSDFSFLLPISRGNLSPWSSCSWVCNTLLRQQRTAANKDHPSALQNVFSWLLGREHTDHHCSSAFYCNTVARESPFSSHCQTTADTQLCGMWKQWHAAVSTFWKYFLNPFQHTKKWPKYMLEF